MQLLLFLREQLLFLLRFQLLSFHGQHHLLDFSDLLCILDSSFSISVRHRRNHLVVALLPVARGRAVGIGSATHLARASLGKFALQIPAPVTQLSLG